MMVSMNIGVQGDGVAAYCSALLLRQAGYRVSLRRTDRPRLPVIMLNDAALALIRDIFNRPDAFCDAPRIRKRIVAWEKPPAGDEHRTPVVLDHSAVVVSEQSLLAILGQGLEIGDGEEIADGGWTIFAAGPLPEAVTARRFGSRIASAVHVDLLERCDSTACWIESLENGWLFLIPDTPQAGWLLAVGGAAESLLDQSQVIAPVIAKSSSAGEFPAYPRIVSPLCGPGWLACGTAAMAFDPICGDGTANAVREAILAAAVVRAIAEGGNERELLSHYESRLTAGFRRHLALCREFYRTGYGGPWWDEELQSLERGLESFSEVAGSQTEFRYQLSGLELKRLP